MPLPELDESGNLPLGVHPASLEEVIGRFGVSTERRQIVGRRLERIFPIAKATGCLLRFIVFGSFVTDEPAPNDVDVFMVMADTFDSQRLTGEGNVLFDHNSADAHFGASVFWIRNLAAIGGVQATVEYWQVKRDGGKRGIIEIVGSEHDTK